MGKLCPVCKKHRLADKRAKRCGKCYRKRVDIPSEAEVYTCACGKPKSDKRSKQCRDCYEASTKPDLVPVVEQTPERDVELLKARETAKRYKKLYEAKTKNDVEEQRLIRLFQTSINSLPEIPRQALKAPEVPTKRRPTREAPVLLLGDMHVGQVIESSATHGINEYNFDIWQDRLEYLEGRVIDILFSHQTSQYDELFIASLGDNVSGVIHEELQKYGAQHLIDQVYIGALATAVFVARLATRFKRVRFRGQSGNHGRLGKAKESSQYYKNFDLLFNAIIATRLQDTPNVVVEIPKATFSVAEIAKHRILISHGMELPPSSMGLPAYSVSRASGSYQEILRMVGEHYDYWVLGHIHRPMELDTAIVNGCFPGFDEYSVGKLFKPIRPMQKLLGFHETHGKSWEYPIQLHKAPKAKVYRFAHDMGASEALDFADEVLTA